MSDVGGTPPTEPTNLPPSGTEGQGPSITPDPGTSLPPPNTDEPPPNTQQQPPPSTTTQPLDPPTEPPPIVSSTTSSEVLPPSSQIEQPIVSTTPSIFTTFQSSSTPPIPPTTQAPTTTTSDTRITNTTNTTSFTTIVATLEDGSLSTTISALPTQLATGTPSKDSSRKNGLIAGTTTAGIIALLIILGVVFLLRRKKLKKQLSEVDALLKSRKKRRGLLEDEDWDDDGPPTRYRDFAPPGQYHAHDRSLTSTSQISAYNYAGHIGGLGPTTGYGYTPLADPFQHQLDPVQLESSLSSIKPPAPQFMRDPLELNTAVGVGVGQGGRSSGNNSATNSAQGSRPSTPNSPTAWKKPSESGSIFREEGVWPPPNASSVSVAAISLNAGTSPGIGTGMTGVIDHPLAHSPQSIQGPTLPFLSRTIKPSTPPKTSPLLIIPPHQPHQNLPYRGPGIASVYPSIARLTPHPPPPPFTHTQTQTHLHPNPLLPNSKRSSLPQISPLSSISTFTLGMGMNSSSHSPAVSNPGIGLGRRPTSVSGHSTSYASFVSGNTVSEGAMARDWMYDMEGIPEGNSEAEVDRKSRKRRSREQRSREVEEHMHMVSSSHQVNVTYQNERHVPYVVEAARMLTPPHLSTTSSPSPTTIPLPLPIPPPPPNHSFNQLQSQLQVPPPVQQRQNTGESGFQLPPGAAPANRPGPSIYNSKPTSLSSRYP